MERRLRRAYGFACRELWGVQRVVVEEGGERGQLHSRMQEERVTPFSLNDSMVKQYGTPLFRQLMSSDVLSAGT